VLSVDSQRDLNATHFPKLATGRENGEAALLTLLVVGRASQMMAVHSFLVVLVVKSLWKTVPRAREKWLMFVNKLAEAIRRT